MGSHVLVVEQEKAEFNKALRWVCNPSLFLFFLGWLRHRSITNPLLCLPRRRQKRDGRLIQWRNCLSTFNCFHWEENQRTLSSFGRKHFVHKLRSKSFWQAGAHIPNWRPPNTQPTCILQNFKVWSLFQHNFIGSYNTSIIEYLFKVSAWTWSGLDKRDASGWRQVDRVAKDPVVDRWVVDDDQGGQMEDDLVTLKPMEIRTFIIKIQTRVDNWHLVVKLKAMKYNLKINLLIQARFLITSSFFHDIKLTRKKTD